MNENQENVYPAVSDLNRIIVAIRFALVCIMLGLSYANIRVSVAIPDFQRVFADMLNGAALSATTSLVIRWHLILFVSSCLIPVAAFATLFSQPTVRSFYFIGVLALLTICQIVIICTGLFDPLLALSGQLSALPK